MDLVMKHQFLLLTVSMAHLFQSKLALLATPDSEATLSVVLCIHPSFASVNIIASSSLFTELTKSRQIIGCMVLTPPTVLLVWDLIHLFGRALLTLKQKLQLTQLSLEKSVFTVMNRSKPCKQTTLSQTSLLEVQAMKTTKENLVCKSQHCRTTHTI